MNAKVNQLVIQHRFMTRLVSRMAQAQGYTVYYDGDQLPISHRQYKKFLDDMHQGVIDNLAAYAGLMAQRYVNLFGNAI